MRKLRATVTQAVRANALTAAFVVLIVAALGAVLTQPLGAVIALYVIVAGVAVAVTATAVMVVYLAIKLIARSWRYRRMASAVGTVSTPSR